MLILLENKKEKIAAQKLFEDNLRHAWSERELRKVTWRSSSENPGNAMVNIAHNGKYWFFSNKPHAEQNTARYWNSVGRYQEGKSLQIIVELNIPTESNSKMVAGFFARDSITGELCLMHDGGVGGGQKGIGKSAFLSWSRAKLVPVFNSENEVREGIIVTSLESHALGQNIGRFLETVDGFKQAVRSGTVSTDAEIVTEELQGSYDREFSGLKKGQRTIEIEYLTRHGDIVHELMRWRSEKHGLQNGEEIFNTTYIDLGVIGAKKQLAEVYEVKTNLMRQTLYTAIGQILVHGNHAMRRFIVLPVGDPLPDDVLRALATCGIELLRFELNSESVIIHG